MKQWQMIMLNHGSFPAFSVSFRWSACNQSSSITAIIGKHTYTIVMYTHDIVHKTNDKYAYTHMQMLKRMQ